MFYARKRIGELMAAKASAGRRSSSRSRVAQIE